MSVGERIEAAEGAERQTIADVIACRDCQALADGADFYRVTRAFRSTSGGAIVATAWRVRTACRVMLKPPPGESPGEWAYGKHAYLAHPEARGEYVPLCLYKDRLEPSRPGAGRARVPRA